MRRLIFLIILAGVLAAQSAQFSCETYYTLSPQVFNSGYSQGQLIGNCAGDTWRWNNIDFTMVQKFGSVQPVSITQNLSGSFNWTAFPDGTNQLVSRVDVNYIGDIVNGTSILLIGPSAGTTNATANGVPVAKPTEQKYLIFYVYNSTTYNMTSDYGSFLLNKGDNLTMFAMSFNIPRLNVSKLTEFHLARDHSAPGTFSPSVTFSPNGWKLTDETPPFMNVSDFTYNGTGVISKAWNGPTGFDTLPGTGFYNATFVASSTLKSGLNFYPIAQKFYTTQYSNTTLITHVMNNQNAIVFDLNSGTWYFCPAFLATNFTPVYTITCIPQAGGGSISVLNTSLIWPTKDCYTANNYFYWNLQGTRSFDYLLQVTLTNSTVYNAMQTGISYSGNYSLTNVSNITLTANGQSLCAWGNQSTILFANMPIFQNSNITKMVGQVMILSTFAVSTVVPFAAIAPIALNDTFGFLSPTEMFIAFCLSMGVAFFKNYNSVPRLKSIGIFVALALSMLITMSDIGFTHGVTTLQPSFYAPLQASFDSATAFIQAPNLVSFVAAAATFIISFFTFLLNLPNFVGSLIFSPISAINPTLGSIATTIFGNVILVGLSVYILLTAWEVISNRFRGVNSA